LKNTFIYNILMYSNQSNEHLNLTTICDKYDILLQKDKKSNIYYIAFECKNQHINLEKMINFKIFKTMFKLNTDIIENMEMVKNNKKDYDIVYYFKSLNDSLGLKKNYMSINTKLHKKEGLYKFISNDINKNVNDYKKITSVIDNLNIKIKDKHNILVYYIFKMDINYDLPLYMENTMGFLMKKSFYRLKSFIENLK